MSTMVSYEDAVDRMTAICIRKLTEFATDKRRFAFPEFMQYYAFDVIGEITVRPGPQRGMNMRLMYRS